MTTLPHWFRPLLQLAETLLALLVEALRSLLLCLRPATALAAKIFFCVNNSPSTRSAISNLAGPRMLPASAWYGSGAGSTGVRR